MTKKIHALDLLKEVMNKQLWYKDKYEQRKAANHKVRLMAGKMRLDTAIEILENLGYKITEPETWQYP